MIDHESKDTPWLPSPKFFGGKWDVERLSGSVVNRRLPNIYMGNEGHGLAGFIFSAESAGRSLLCAYPHEASSVGSARCPRDSDTWTGEWRCLPGCMGASAATRRSHRASRSRRRASTPREEEQRAFANTIHKAQHASGIDSTSGIHPIPTSRAATVCKYNY